MRRPCAACAAAAADRWCGVVQVKSSFTKRVQFARLPQVLCFHLNRLVADHKIHTFVQFYPVCSAAQRSSGQGSAGQGGSSVVLCCDAVMCAVLSGAVRLPLWWLWRQLLDMSAYCAVAMSYSKSAGAAASAAAFAAAAAPTGGAGVSVRSDPSRVYRLIAVVVHHGGASGGHFTTFRRLRTKGEQKQFATPTAATAAPAAPAALAPPSDPAGAQDSDGEEQAPPSNSSATYDFDAELQRELRAEWVHISDEQVLPCDVRQALSAQAYMLFYERLAPAGLNVH